MAKLMPSPNILDYWLSVEYFQPQPVPRVEPNKSDSPVFELTADSPPNLMRRPVRPLQQRHHTLQPVVIPRQLEKP